VADDELIVWAPGRVNLMGDHTDYIGGLALPMAIHLGTTITGRALDGRVRLESEGFEGTVDLALGPDLPRPEDVLPVWGRYVATVAAKVQPARGFEGRITTTIPIGAGLSSSAALEVAVARALDATLVGTDLALACQAAEHAASGVPCGVMDQLTAIAGTEGHALLVDFRALTWELVAVPPSVEVVVVHSGQTRELAGSEYGNRIGEVTAAEREIGPLRDATLDDVRAIRDPKARARARHVVTEIERVRAFARALSSEDMSAAGAIVAESFISNRDDFEASTPIVDTLVERLSATPGVWGARLVGGGFGGCVVALTEPGALDEGWVVRPAGGARVQVLRRGLA
jgi:galactokinase